MTRKLFSAIVLALLLVGMLTLTSNVQRGESLESPSVKWSHTYGDTGADQAYSMIQTNDGGYALAGTTFYDPGLSLFCFVKTDLLGNMQWIRWYGGPWYGDGVWGQTAYAVVQTSDGGYALAGYSPLNGGDFWLFKTDSDGFDTWSRTYGGESDWMHSEEVAYSLIQTDDGGYALAGITMPSCNAWLVKTDSVGNMLWNRTYGGAYYDAAYSLIRTNDGGYALTGETSSDGAHQQFWMVKTDSGGNEQWTQTYDGSYANSLIQTVDGGYALAGCTNPFGAGSGDFELVKTDAYGNMLWNKTYGGTGSEEAFSVIQTSDGGYALAGYTESFGAGSDDAWLVKTDPDGNMQWNETFGGTNEDQVWSVVQTSYNEYVLGGWTKSFGDDNGDFWLFKVAAPVPLSPYIRVVPEETVDPTIEPGMNYTISIYTDYAGSDIWGWQFNLTFNPSVLQMGFNITDTWVGDGVTVAFTASRAPVVSDSEKIYVSQTLMTKDVNYTISYETGEITFTIAPGLGAEVKAEYVWTGLLNGDLIAAAKNPSATFLPGTFNNTVGRLSLTCAFFFYVSPPPPPPTTSGPGTLVYITFRVVGYGSSDIILGNKTKLVGPAQPPDYLLVYKIIDASQPEGRTSPPYGSDHIGHGHFENAPAIMIEDVMMTPAAPNYDDEVNVTATIKGDISEALLYYTYDSAWRNAIMTKSGETYNAAIPPQPYETLVQYKVHANDTNGYSAESELYSYSVIDDVKPDVVAIRYPTQPRASQVVKVSANLIEPVNASGVRNVTFYYRVNDNPWWSTSMVFNGQSGLWETSIPGHQAHDLVEYYIKAQDNAGNESTTETFSYQISLQGDANLDHKVDILDAAILSAHWYPGPPIGPLGYDSDYDLNSDGSINILDSAIVNSQWNQTW